MKTELYLTTFGKLHTAGLRLAHRHPLRCGAGMSKVLAVALTPLGGGNLYGYSVFGSGSSPFSTLFGAYQALLSKGCFDWDVSHKFTLTLNNLTVGATYQIQIWANDSQNTGASVRDTRVGTSTNLVTLHQNSGWSSGVGASGGVGQYVIGTFTANNPAQLFTFDQPTNNSLTINAFQLRVLPSYANTPTNISYSVGRSTLTLTWPGSHQGWIAQSNSVNLENTNDWFNIAGSASVTNLNIPMSQSGNVFYRLPIRNGVPGSATLFYLLLQP